MRKNKRKKKKARAWPLMRPDATAGARLSGDDAVSPDVTRASETDESETPPWSSPASSRRSSEGATHGAVIRQTPLEKRQVT